MPLCTPRIIGPLTSWSRTLLIEGAVPGATVTVREGSPGGAVAARAVVRGGRDRIPLLAGVTLSAGRPLLASQSLGETSAWTRVDLAERVGPAPTDHGPLPPPWVRTQLFTCGQAAWVAGCVPGAEVTVTGAGGPYGRGVAHEGVARLRLDDPLPGSPVDVAIVAAAPPGVPTPAGTPPTATVQVAPLPVADGGQLPDVRVGEPLPMGCDPSIVIRDVVAGAEVTVARVDEGLVETALFDLDSLTLLLDTPLDPSGGRITVTQAVGARCGVRPSRPVIVGFGPVQKPPAPRPEPPCGGSELLWVAGLSPGADVSITVGAVTYRAAASPSAVAQAFELAPMAEGSTVTVTQARCGVASDPASVTVTSAPVAGPPVVAGPLLRCARVVRVTGVTPGAVVRVIARGPWGESPISTWRRSPTSTIAVEVAPSLIEGDDVYAEQVACGGAPSRSVAPVPVEALWPPLPVEIAFAFATQRAVTVVALPGAYVRVFRRRDGIQEIGAGLVDPGNDRIAVAQPLTAGDHVFAVQHICDLESEPGPAYRVRPGEKIFDLGPARRRPITSEPAGRDVIWSAATLTCRVDGEYRFRAGFENKAEETVVDIAADVEVSHPAGLRFGATVNIKLAADDDKHPDNALLKAQGYRAADEDVTTGVEPRWRDPGQWVQILDGTAEFRWLVAPWTLPESEADDGEDDDKDKPPPPSG